MNLEQVIYRRKSVRKYKSEPVDKITLEKIMHACSEFKPLYPDIKLRAEIVDKENVRCMLPWTTQQVVAIFSEEKDGYLENVGFVFQQLDLYLQSIGLGCCWLGMGRLNSAAKSEVDDDLKFVIMLAFGYPNEELRSDISQFKRKSMLEISDIDDKCLEPARLAPSSVNSQPWYFTHDGDVVDTYCVKHGLFKSKVIGEMNQIDVGIALAHMYVANPETFRFFVREDAKEIKNYGYIGSFMVK